MLLAAVRLLLLPLQKGSRVLLPRAAGESRGLLMLRRCGVWDSVLVLTVRVDVLAVGVVGDICDLAIRYHLGRVVGLPRAGSCSREGHRDDARDSGPVRP